MNVKHGILSHGAYIPYWRLDRKDVAGFNGGRGHGTRSVASYDEDTTSMGVEAARVALTGVNSAPTSVFFATADPAYQDKTNATAITAALSLGEDVLSADLAGAVRSGVGAMHAGLRGDDASLVVLSDIRTGLPGSIEEREGGDAAAAFVLGPEATGPLLAEYLGGASTSAEFLDRWRRPGAHRSEIWEERFGEGQYVALATRALEKGLAGTGLSLEDVDHVAVAGLQARGVKSFIRKAKLQARPLVDDLLGVVGNTGAAHPGLLLSAALDEARPGELIALVVLADGADVLFFRTTDHLADWRSSRPIAEQVTSGRAGLGYRHFLTWRGHLEQEPPRRPEPDRPAAPPSFQREHWKFGFVGSVCECGQGHLPPQRVCVSCQSVDAMTSRKYADSMATVATYAVDHLAYSLSPPMVTAVIDFEGGGRYLCEVTDCDPDEIGVGTRVEMTFRRLFTAGGVHNYFWKARPVAVATVEEEPA